MSYQRTTRPAEPTELIEPAGPLPSPTRTARRTVRHAAVAATVLAAAFAIPSPAVAATTATDATGTAIAPEPFTPSMPEPTGRYDVGQVDLHLVDEDREDPWADDGRPRELMTTVWYPARPRGGEPAPYLSTAMADWYTSELERLEIARDAVDLAGIASPGRAGAPATGRPSSVPVLLYSPGHTRSRQEATAVVAELASQGYAVVTVDHPHEAEVVEFPDGRVVGSRLPWDEWSGTEIRRAAVGTRVADLSFVLDSLADLSARENPDAADRRLPARLATVLDVSRVGAFGHSLGGFTAAEAMLVDERVDAGVDLDGSIAYHVGDEEWADVTTAGLDRPFLLMGAGNPSRDAPHNSRHAPDWRMFRDASTGDSLELFLPEGAHFGYSDYQWLVPQVDAALRPDSAVWEEAVVGSVGTIDPERSLAAQRAYVTAFFEEYLRGEEQPLLDGPSDAYPDVEFID